jgi:hypothetical protein
VSAVGAQEPQSDLKDARKAKKAKQARTVAYESAGPQQLVKQPARAIPPKDINTLDWTILKSHLEGRLNMLRSYRFSWMLHYQLLETYILPRRGIFINPTVPTPNTMIKGQPINQNILNPTGTYAMRRAAAGLMSGLMSPSRPWFKLKPAMGSRDEVDADAQAWFEECEDRIYQVAGRSNFYDSGAQMFEDLVTFGTSPMIIYEDETDVIRCYTPCCGEYLVASSSANRVESLYRQFIMTASAIVEMFGLENCPPDLQAMWQSKAGSLDVEYIVFHSIEPNFGIANQGRDEVGVVEGGFDWREVYWLASSGQFPLSMRGFIDQPHICPRWATTSNDAYGRSVGMDVLPDIMQLQVEEARKAEAIEKMVRPPLLASMEMKNEPSSILPGHITYVNALGPDKGMRPTYTVNPQIKEMAEDIQGVMQRIREGFFNDLFMMPEPDAQKMTAYEVSVRRQEKLQVLGPVIERLQNEALAPAIKRIFRIMERRGLLPPLPESLQGVQIGIEYVSMLAIAQKQAESAGLGMFASTMMNLAQADPNVADLWNRDIWTEKYAQNTFIPAEVLNPKKVVADLRKARASEQAAAQAAQMGVTAVEAAKSLGQSSIAPDTALGAMMPQGQA